MYPLDKMYSKEGFLNILNMYPVMYSLSGFKQPMQSDEDAIKNFLTMTKWGGAGTALGPLEPLRGDSTGTAAILHIQLSTRHQFSEANREN